MKSGKEILHALFSTIFLFGLLTWLYVIAIQITHPEWIQEPLSHIDIFPLNARVDETGIAAFIASVVAFLFLQLTSERRRGDRNILD